VKGEEFLRTVENPFAEGCLLLKGSDRSGLREMGFEKEGQWRWQKRARLALQEKGTATWERESDVMEAIGEEEESIEGRRNESGKLKKGRRKKELCVAWVLRKEKRDREKGKNVILN